MTISRSARMLVMSGLALLLSASCPRASWASSFGLACASYQGDIDAAVHRWWFDLRVPLLWTAQLWTESRCNPEAVSPVGALGIAQIMPGTGRDLARRLGVDPFTSPHVAKFAIPAGAAYMAQLRGQWGRGRAPLDRHDISLGSYNAGLGSILRSQARCNDALLWADIAPCLGSITGDANAKETTNYVVSVRRFWQQFENVK